MNNFITNISRQEIIDGRHEDAGENSMLIQIVDFFDTFPEPKYNFKYVLQFKFDDIETGPTAISDRDAEFIADALRAKKDQKATGFQQQNKPNHHKTPNRPPHGTRRSMGKR